MGDNTNNEELRFWEQNRFAMFIDKRTPNKVPNIEGVKELLKHINETGDYYAVLERVKKLKGESK